MPILESGAREGTRTPTPVRAPGPKPGASTNFATLAGTTKGRFVESGNYTALRIYCKWSAGFVLQTICGRFVEGKLRVKRLYEFLHHFCQRLYFLHIFG